MNKRREISFNNPIWQKDAEDKCRSLGYHGFAASKQHYNGDESALTAYKKHYWNDKILLVKQCSQCFCFRIEHQN